MAAQAYVLVRTAPGLTKAVCSSIRISPIVQSVELITGPYDVIARMEAESTNEILMAIMNHIRPSEGVLDTLTCLVIPGEGLDQKED